MADILTKLFGTQARVKLLRLFLFNPHQAFTAQEAAARARVPLHDAQAELTLFTKIDLVNRGRGRLARYTLNDDFTYLLPLQNLLLNAPARTGELYERVRGTGILKLIVVGGVFVGEWDGGVDLLIVGDRIHDEKLRKNIRLLESEIGKEIRYTLLSSNEFFYRLNMSDHLVRDVLDYPHRIIFDKLDIGLE